MGAQGFSGSTLPREPMQAGMRLTARRTIKQTDTTPGTGALGLPLLWAQRKSPTRGAMVRFRHARHNFPSSRNESSRVRLPA